jgi:hypothetical protein
MSPTDINKNAGSGPYKGKPRKQIFDLKIKAKSPFLLDNGKGELTPVEGLKWDAKSNVLTAKIKSQTKTFTVSLRYIAKDVDFGGSPKDKSEGGDNATVGGKEVEVFSEAFFCYYFALKAENKLSGYSPLVWKTITNKQQLDAWTRKTGIHSYVETQNSDKAFTSRLNLAILFLVGNGWHDRLVKQMDKFFSVVKPANGKNYEAMRADEVPSEINSQEVFTILAEKAKQKFGFSRAVDKDKWNPGDVWIFSTQGKQKLKNLISKARQQASSPAPYMAGAVADLNKIIYDLYVSKDLFPVSLKAPGATVHVSEENAVGSNITKTARFIKTELGPTNLDVKIHFAVDLYDEKKKQVVEKNYLVGRIKSKTDTGGFRLEIEAPGAGARFGSIGTENYQWIIFNTDNTGVKKLQSVREGFKELEDVLPSKTAGDKEWLGASGIQSFVKKNPKDVRNLVPYLDKMYKLINGSGEFQRTDPKDIMNKTIASEIAVAIEFITNKLTRDVTVENLYDLAASQRFSAGVRAEQLAKRKGIYSKEAKALGAKEAQYVFESCFYLKVY